MTTTTTLPTSANYTVTPTGIEFKKSLTHEEWCALGKALAATAKSIGFRIGDWINFGSATYGEKYKEALESTDIPYNTLTNYASVAHKVAPSAACANPSFWDASPQKRKCTMTTLIAVRSRTCTRSLFSSVGGRGRPP